MAKAEVDYKVGDKVKIKPNKQGQILYKGEPKGWGGTYYGIRLTKATGDCDGEYKNQRFFRCPKNCGKYVQKKLIIGLLDKKDAELFDYTKETEELKKQKEKSDEKYSGKQTKLKQLKRVFKETDKDGNLTLDLKEFKKLAKDVLQCDDKEAEKLFKTIDSNGSGKVSFAEFDSWLGDGGITKLEQYSKLKDMFKETDKDGNKTLDCKEFAALAKKAMNLDEKDSKELFEKIDTNKSGDISFDEFDAYLEDIGGLENLKTFSELKKYFKDADKDKNNGLDLKEFIELSKKKLNIPSYKAKRLFGKVDTNGNGTIQFSEFEDYVNRIGGVRKIKEKEEEQKDKE